MKKKHIIGSSKLAQKIIKKIKNSAGKKIILSKETKLKSRWKEKNKTPQTIKTTQSP